jgi:hypothetical protein
MQENNEWKRGYAVSSVDIRTINGYNENVLKDFK